jgi:hypothetical protein
MRANEHSLAICPMMKDGNGNTTTNLSETDRRHVSDRTGFCPLHITVAHFKDTASGNYRRVVPTFVRTSFAFRTMI